MGKTSGEPSFGNQGVLGRALRRLSTLIWGRHVWQDKSLGILIASSNRGRQFPTKAWDQGYFDLLCDSQFVLCPDGDFQWTYRFFEAVICGAIPVVQSESAIYHGYAYRVMNKANLARMNYSLEEAEHNFSLAESLLTLEPQLLDRELIGLLQDVAPALKASFQASQ